ncbi:MAG: hypothetical protein JW741_04350 [Sedimentisphaerales bacterium]|nr:hypothetical protein [Sedimentisphaerales bacterium]
MAHIVLSGDELVNILDANELIPDHVTDIHTNGEEIRIRVKTPWPLLKSLRVGIRFMGFDDGQVVLQLVTNRVLDRFDWLIDRMLESLRLEDHGSRWEYPHLFVDVNRLIQRQLRGVTVNEMTFEDGYFHISTTHACDGASGDPAIPDQEGGDAEDSRQ